MAEDVFGDDLLFEGFDAPRHAENAFLHDKLHDHNETAVKIPSVAVQCAKNKNDVVLLESNSSDSETDSVTIETCIKAASSHDSSIEILSDNACSTAGKISDGRTTKGKTSVIERHCLPMVNKVCLNNAINKSNIVDSLIKERTRGKKLNSLKEQNVQQKSKDEALLDENREELIPATYSHGTFADSDSRFTAHVPLVNLCNQPNSKKSSSCITDVDTRLKQKLSELKKQKGDNFELSLTESLKLELDAHKEVLLSVHRENEELRQLANLLDVVDSWKSTEQGPVMQVLFHNNTNAIQYRGEIEMALGELMRRDTTTVSPCIPVTASQSKVVYACQRFKKGRCHQMSAVLGSLQLFRQFFVDVMGHYTPTEFPEHDRLFDIVLPVCDEEDEMLVVKENPKPSRKAMSCFNCGNEGHPLNQCPEVRDPVTIKKNRDEFLNSRSSQPPNMRYHQEVDVNGSGPSFSRIKPGVISQQLREALGVAADQLPPYIYNMRRLGFPPGWLQDAEHRGSGLTMYDAKGAAIEGTDQEDGEVMERSDPDNVCIDMDRIVEYPGFNVPIPENVRDEWREYGSVPMLSQHQKSVMSQLVKTLKKRPLKRKRSFAASHAKRQRTGDSSVYDDDMDLDGSGVAPSASRGWFTDNDSFIPPLPPPDIPPPLPKSLPESPQSSVPNSPGGLDLKDLEKKRARLLAELKDASESQDSDLPDVTDEGRKENGVKEGGPGWVVLSTISDVDNDEEAAEGASFAEDVNDVTSVNALSMDDTTSLKSLSMELGTPHIQHSVSCLPDAGKWAEGINEHLPHENLPGATGTFAKLRKTIKNIRNAFKNL